MFPCAQCGHEALLHESLNCGTMQVDRCDGISINEGCADVCKCAYFFTSDEFITYLKAEHKCLPPFWDRNE